MKARVLVGTVVGITALLGTSGNASAAPKGDPGFTVTFTNCPGHDGYEGALTVAGNGRWTPAFGGGAVFLPVSFGPFTGTEYFPGGSRPISEPAVTQNATKGGNHSLVTCEYFVAGSFGEFGFEGTGEVTFIVVGKP